MESSQHSAEGTFSGFSPKLVATDRASFAYTYVLNLSFKPKLILKSN